MLYLINLLDRVHTIIPVAVLISGLLTVLLIIFGYGISEGHSITPPKAKQCFLAAKICLIITVVCINLAIFVPDKSTAQNMVISYYLTPQYISTLQAQGVNDPEEIIKSIINK